MAACLLRRLLHRKRLVQVLLRLLEFVDGLVVLLVHGRELVLGRKELLLGRLDVLLGRRGEGGGDGGDEGGEDEEGSDHEPRNPRSSPDHHPPWFRPRIGPFLFGSYLSLDSLKARSTRASRGPR